MSTHLYILACAGPEDLLKVGMANNPLTRFAAFHPCWPRYFDLEASALVQFDARGEARHAETALHRRLREHRAPMPLETRGFAGGAGEWYRGAAPELVQALSAFEQQGHAVTRGLEAWARRRLAAEEPRLMSLLDVAITAHHAGQLDAARRKALRDLLESHLHVDAGVAARVPGQTFEVLALAGWVP